MAENTPPPDCPDCGRPLTPIERPASSLLNDAQFDAIRAGDYFCRTCPPNDPVRGNRPVRYFWRRELAEAPVPAGG